MEISSQQDLERKIAGLRNEVQVQIMLLYAIVLCYVDDIQYSSFILLLCIFGIQCMEHTVLCLEEQQDEFDFKYQTHKMEGKQI